MGYDHILLTEGSRAFFEIQLGGWYIVYKSLPLGWKISPYVYHTTAPVATNFFRSIGIPCLLYIDNCHNGDLQVPLDKGHYAAWKTADERRRTPASRPSSGNTRLLSRPSEIDTEKGSFLLGISSRLSPSGVPSETRQEAVIP